MDVLEETLRVAMCYNESFSPLARHCCRTISHEKIRVYKSLESVESEGFRSPGWYRFTRIKIEMLHSIFEVVRDGEIVGMTDCDMQFFSPKTILDVRDSMVSSQYDYVGLAEACYSEQDKNDYLFKNRWCDANTGFILLRKCNQTFRFLDEVLSRSFNEKFLGDQGVINEVLNSTGLKCALLNPYFFHHGCCEPHKDIITHHTTCAHNLKQKIDQINWVRNKINLNSVNWDDQSFGDSCI